MPTVVKQRNTKPISALGFALLNDYKNYKNTNNYNYQIQFRNNQHK